VPTNLRRLAGPVAVTLALYAALMALYVGKHGGHVSTLLCAGSNRAGRPPYEAVLVPVGPNGYDGQFYYAIAQAPWRPHDGERIDHPAARHLRILYPALCWLGSGGDPHALLWVMPTVNLLVLGALAGAGAAFAVRHGRSPWWGVTLPIGVNAGLAALHNLTDPLATLTVFGLLAAWLTGSGAPALGLWAAAALLAREQNLLLVVLLLGLALYRRRPHLAAGLLAASLLWAAWVAAVALMYGDRPFLGGPNVFGVPLAGMAYRWAHPGGNAGFSRRLAVLLVGSMAHLTLLIGLGLYLAARERRHDPAVRLCLLAGVALAVTAGTGFYNDFWSYTRVFVWLPLGIWIAGLRGRLDWAMACLSPYLLWNLAGALRYV
jgi:hypothetical protein